jgi:hypothetical protein
LAGELPGSGGGCGTHRPGSSGGREDDGSGGMPSPLLPPPRPAAGLPLAAMRMGGDAIALLCVEGPRTRSRALRVTCLLKLLLLLLPLTLSLR